MARKKGGGHAGGHGWFVTFADLMGLLMSFFVMLVAFSNQDQHKLQIVAGSMRDAFGVQTNVRYSGIIEVPGLPTRPKLKQAEHIPPEEASATPQAQEHDRQEAKGTRLKEDRAFALAAASLRQAMQDMPELTEASKHVMIEETKEGINIEIVDQDGRSMFPEGSKEPYERTRKVIEKIAGPLRAVGTVGRPRQRGSPHSTGRRRARNPFLPGRRQGRHRAAVSGRSLHRGQSARHHHADARGTAAAGRIQALISRIAASGMALAPRAAYMGWRP
jgi:Membrane MotB of proton-channel complex MotA/MotB